MTDRKQEVAKLKIMDIINQYDMKLINGETAADQIDALYKLPEAQQIKDFLFEAERQRIWNGHDGVYVPSYLDTARDLLALLQQDTKDTCPEDTFICPWCGETKPVSARWGKGYCRSCSGNDY